MYPTTVQLTKDEITYRDDLIKITGARRRGAKRATQGEQESAEDEAQEQAALLKRCTDLQKRLKSSRFSALQRRNMGLMLDRVREDLDNGSDVSARLKELEKLASSVKNRSQKGEMDHVEWLRTGGKEIKQQFLAESQEVVESLTTAAREKAAKLATKSRSRKREMEAASKAPTFDFILKPMLALREDLADELVFLSAPEKQKDEVVKRYGSKLAASEKELKAFIAGKDFLGGVCKEVQAKEQEEKAKQDGQANAALQDAKKTALRHLARLADLNDTDVAYHRKEIEKAYTLPRVAIAVTGIVGAIETEQKKGQDRANAHDLEVKALSSKINKSKSGLDDKRKAAMDQMQKELEQTQALTATGNPNAADAAGKLKANIEAAANAAADENSELNKLFAQTDKVKQTLDDETITKFYPDDKKQLLEDLDKIVKGVDALDPAASMEELGAVEAKVATLRIQAVALRQWQDVTKREIAKLRKEMEEATWGKLEALFRGNTKMKVLVEEIEAGLKPPNTDRQHINDLKQDLFMRINKLRKLRDAAKATSGKAKAKADADVDAALKAEQQEVRDEGKERKAKKDEEERIRKEFEKKVSDFSKEVSTVRDKVKKAGGPVDEIKIVESIAKTALELGKNTDIKSGEEKLKAAKAKLADLDGFPGGYTMKSAKYLETAPKLWKSAIASAEGKVNEVAKEAKELAASAGVKESGKVETKVKSVAALFKKENLFDAPIKTLTSEDAKPRDRKAAREQVLQQIRKMRAVLDTNPMVQLVRRNPFDKKAVTLPLTKFLNNLELNALRSVRPE